MRFLRRILADQVAEPQGLLGRLVGWMMARGNQESNEWMVSLLDLEEDDHVLEIGFGPGTAIREIAAQTSKGHVAGIDVSEAMIDQATKLNQEAVDAGRVDLRLGEATSMPWPSDRFDKALAVNVIYLWPHLDPVLSEIRRVLKPRGLLALYLAPVEQMEKLGFSEVETFTLHIPEKVRKVCRETGFTRVEQTSAQMEEGTGVCVKAWK